MKDDSIQPASVPPAASVSGGRQQKSPGEVGAGAASAASPPSSMSAPHSQSQWEAITRSLVSGGLAGCVAKTVVAPLDRVKILFQGANSSVSHFSGSMLGPFRALKFIADNQGMRGLYKGHQATLLRIFPYAALNYMCYEQYKRLFRKQTYYPIHSSSPNDLPPAVRLVAGSMAGLTSVFFTYPLDFVHSRLAYQVKRTRYKGIADTIRLTREEAGIKGLYRGFGATALGIIPYAGMSFFTYDTLKHAAADHYTRKAALEGRTISLDDPATVPVVVRLMCGAFAGAAAQTASYPLDVVRRRMQLYGLSTHVPKYRSTLDGIVTIIRTEGIKKLYIGLSINYLKVPPSHAVSFVVYEAVQGWMRGDKK